MYINSKYEYETIKHALENVLSMSTSCLAFCLVKEDLKVE